MGEKLLLFKVEEEGTIYEHGAETKDWCDAFLSTPTLALIYETILSISMTTNTSRYLYIPKFSSRVGSIFSA